LCKINLYLHFGSRIVSHFFDLYFSLVIGLYNGFH